MLSMALSELIAKHWLKVEATKNWMRQNRFLMRSSVHPMSHHSSSFLNPQRHRQDGIPQGRLHTLNVGRGQPGNNR